MRSTLPVVLAVVLVNDAVLLVALDVDVPAWLAVGGAAVALTGLFALVVTTTVDGDSPPSRAELQQEVAALRDRVAELED
ncbi:MAG: hypothetical protein ABEH83_06210 [Halobacterium sp.]